MTTTRTLGPLTISACVHRGTCGATRGPMRVAMRVALLVSTLLCACTLNFDRFLDGASSDGADPADGDDAPIGDGATDVPADVDLRCERPYVAVAVEDLSSGTGASVARYSLAGTGRMCAPLRGGGMLPASARTVAVLPDGRVAYVSTDGVDLIDADRDTVVARHRTTWSPIDAFPLRDPASEVRIAVAYGGAGVDMVRGVRLFDVAAAVLQDWPTNAASGPVALGLSVASMTVHPDDDTHLLALASTRGAAVDVAPFGGGPVGVFAPMPMDTVLRTLGSTAAGAIRRVAWTGSPAGMSGSNELRYVGAAEPTPRVLHGPLRCGTSPACGPGEYVHAMPDPTSNLRYLLVCEVSGVVRNVVRLNPTTMPVCSVLLDGVALGSQRRIWRMALAP